MSLGRQSAPCRVDRSIEAIARDDVTLLGWRIAVHPAT